MKKMNWREENAMSPGTLDRIACIRSQWLRGTMIRVEVARRDLDWNEVFRIGDVLMLLADISIHPHPDVSGYHTARIKYYNATRELTGTEKCKFDFNNYPHATYDITKCFSVLDEKSY